MKEADTMDELDFSKVGLKLKQLRMEQGVTQEKVAKDLGCTIAFISNTENNRTKMNLRILLYYSDLCHVSIDSILNAGRPSTLQDDDNSELNEEMLGIFQTFSSEERKKIIKTLKLWAKED